MTHMPARGFESYEGTTVNLDDRPTTGAPSTVSSIPLSEPGVKSNGEQSIGHLVKNASAQVSTLVRAEVALAKAEAIEEAKKAAIGSILTIIAGVIALYASFFFFYFIGELLSEWLPRWASFGIVFLILLVITIAAAIGGVILFKKITGPKKTIASVKETSQILPGKGDHAATGEHASSSGSKGASATK